MSMRGYYPAASSGNPWKQPTSPGDMLKPGVQPGQVSDMNKVNANENINLYEKGTYSWDPLTMGSPQAVQAQNFDLMRQGALRNVNAGVQSGTQTAMSALAGSGGLSAADRRALQAQGQRQRVNLSQGATSAYDQMASQNMYDTQKYNIGQQQAASDMNQDIWNTRNRDIATQNEMRAVNIYQQRLKEALLERQLDAARKIAREQGA